MNRHKISALVILIIFALTGCASIVEGTDQTLTFQISPESAVCKVSQRGALIGTIGNDGGQLRVPKSKEAISVDCTTEGFEKQIVSLDSSASGWGVIGCIFIDLCITDYATGALNKYQTTVTITLPKKSTS